MPRELSDDVLLMELAGFLSYEARGGALHFAAWVDGKNLNASDHDFLTVAYVGATVLQQPRA